MLGLLYDVEFLDGSCVELYYGCDDTSTDFMFKQPITAGVASSALFDKVFLDGFGLYGSMPSLMNGCY